MTIKTESRKSAIRIGLRDGHQPKGLGKGGYQAKVDTSAPVQPPRVGTTAVIPRATSNAKPAQTATDRK
jgi:hypothetical protein